MKRFVLAPLAVLLAWWVAAANPASAQNTYPYMQPRFGAGYTTPLSPFLNLLLPGNTAVNYYALVEPQFQRRQYRNQMNQTLQGIYNQLPTPPGVEEEANINAPLSSAGHPTAFGYTGSYFGSPVIPASITNPMTRRRSASAASGQRQAGSSSQRGIFPNMRPQMGPPRQ
ncbi:MAG TPA: hypothetical protein VMG10_01220 [Gemmataceae bacterium]|nr:hypothetical protein [Gemmataceae bacterium]